VVQVLGRLWRSTWTRISPPRHGVPGVEHQVEQDLLELPGVHAREAHPPAVDGQLDPGRQQALQHVLESSTTEHGSTSVGSRCCWRAKASTG
jgi:hypothetical protein